MQYNSSLSSENHAISSEKRNYVFIFLTNEFTLEQRLEQQEAV